METKTKQRVKGFTKRTIAELNQGKNQEGKGKTLTEGMETYPTVTSTSSGLLTF